MVPVEGRKEAAGGKQDGAPGEGTALFIDPFEVALGDVCHADGSGRAVEELVAVPRESTGSFELCPAQSILLLLQRGGGLISGLSPNLCTPSAGRVASQTT